MLAGLAQRDLGDEFAAGGGEPDLLDFAGRPGDEESRIGQPRREPPGDLDDVELLDAAGDRREIGFMIGRQRADHGLAALDQRRAHADPVEPARAGKELAHRAVGARRRTDPRHARHRGRFGRLQRGVKRDGDAAQGRLAGARRRGVLMTGTRQIAVDGDLPPRAGARDGVLDGLFELDLRRQGEEQGEKQHRLRVREGKRKRKRKTGGSGRVSY